MEPPSVWHGSLRNATCRNGRERVQGMNKEVPRIRRGHISGLFETDVKWKLVLKIFHALSPRANYTDRAAAARR
jgi:hypothetical protein